MGEVRPLYAATGDAIARLEEADRAWSSELTLRGSGAHCLAVDPRDPEVVRVSLGDERC